jgi:hypothetical protein
MTIQINAGPEKTLAELNITAAQLTITNQGQDSLVLNVAANVDDAPLGTAFSKFTLRDDDDVIRFVGWLDQSPVRATGASEGWQYRLNGPWRFLDMVTYKQRWCFQVDPPPDPPTCTDRSSSVVVLSQQSDDPDLVKISIGDQIEDMLDNVIEEQGAVIAYDTDDLDALTLLLPEDKQIDQKVGSCIKKLLQWAPAITAWWDYSTSPPTLRFEHFGSAPSQTLSESLGLTDAQLNPRFDLLRKKITIRYLTPVTDRYFSTTTDIATDTAGDAFTLGCTAEEELTVKLRNSCGSTEETPTGLAAAFLSWCAKLHIDASFTIPELDWDRRPGEAWSFSGIVSNWSAYTSIAQRIVWDLGNERTTVTIGAKGQLGLAESINLSRLNRWRGDSSCGTGSPDTGDEEDCEPPDADTAKTYAWVTKWSGTEWVCQWAEVCSD